MVGIIAAVNFFGIYAHSENPKEVSPNIPWRLKSDLLNFKEVTLGNGNNAILMGVKTRESMPRTLPKRKNVVISSTGKTFPENETFTSLREAITVLSYRHEDLWLIGGYKLWLEGFRYADKVSLTIVEKTLSVNSSTLFCKELIPGSKELKNFEIVSTQSFTKSEDKKDEANFTVLTLRKRKG